MTNKTVCPPASKTDVAQVSSDETENGLGLWSRCRAKVQGFLHAGEERRQFIRSVAGTFFVRLLLIATGLATSVMTARVLGPAGRGAFSAAMVLGAIGSQFGNFGLHSANTYYVVKSPSLLPKILSNTLAFSLATGGLISIILSTFFTLKPAWAPVHGGLLTCALLLIPTLLSQLLLQNLLLGIGEVKWYNAIELFSRVALIVAMVATWIAKGNLAATQILLFAVCANLATLLIAGGRLVYKTGSLPIPSVSLLRTEASYGLRSYITCLGGYLVLKSDILLVKYLAGDTATGLYSLASSMTDFIYTFPSVVGMLLFPLLTGTGDIAARWRRARKTMAGIVGIMSGIAAIAAVLAVPITRLAFGEKFLPAVPAFLILCVAIVFYGANSVISIFFSSCGQPWLSVWIWPAAALLNIGINLLAIPRWGIVGASLASVFTYIVLFAAQYSLAMMHLKKNFMDASTL